MLLTFLGILVFYIFVENCSDFLVKLILFGVPILFLAMLIYVI
jgi:hypothetical protein